MLHFDAETILLDIEGTTSPIDFVYKVLFPFARENMRTFLERTWTEDATRKACVQLAVDCRASDLDAGALANDDARVENIDRLVTEAHKLMDADVKATGLKELQGLIWKQGYEEGKLQSQMFADVAPALGRWKEQRIAVAIYSSGSATAQRSYFSHTESGDLTKYLSGFFDTTSGAKQEAASYKTIAGALKTTADKVLFLSDVPAELDAARTGGMRTLLVVRPGNKPVDTASCQHAAIESFDEFTVTTVVV